MPTYEYTCTKCGRHFETKQSIKDSALTICPKEICTRKPWGKGKVKRAVGGGAGLIFKGSGFYITDYRSENYKAGAKKEAGDAKPAKSETKSSEAPAKTTPAAAPPASSTKKES